MPEERRKVLNGADEAADFRPSGGGRDHTDTSTGIHRRRRELEEKRGEIMKKRRRLRKPIRWALRFVCYAVAAIVADLTVIGAILYYFGDMYIMAALGVCLGVNILTEYFFFKDEFRRKVVKE